jgi:hypothetical protein
MSILWRLHIDFIRATYIVCCGCCACCCWREITIHDRVLIEWIACIVLCNLLFTKEHFVNDKTRWVKFLDDRWNWALWLLCEGCRRNMILIRNRPTRCKPITDRFQSAISTYICWHGKIRIRKRQAYFWRGTLYISRLYIRLSITLQQASEMSMSSTWR